MVCGIVEALTTDCDISNNVTLIVEILISASLAIGLSIYFYRRGRKDMKNQDKLLQQQSKLVRKQSDEINKLMSLVKSATTIIHEQNEAHKNQKKYVLNEIIRFLKNLQKIGKYLLQEKENVPDVRNKYKIETGITFEFNKSMFGLKFPVKIGSFPSENTFNDKIYLLESSKDLLNKEDVLQIRDILTRFKDLLSFNPNGYLKIFDQVLVESDLRKIDEVIKILEEYKDYEPNPFF